MDRPYDERLATMEAEWEAFELLYTQMKAKRAKVLRDRPCDFYLEYEGKRWIQYRTILGEAGGFGWSKVDQYHKAVWTAKTRKSAEQYAVYLEDLKKIKGIEIKERPR